MPEMIFYKWHTPICAQNDSYVRNVAGSTCARNDLLQCDRSSTRPIFARNDLLQCDRSSTRPIFARNDLLQKDRTSTRPIFARNDLLQKDRTSTRPIFARNDLLQKDRTSTRPLSPWVSCYQRGRTLPESGSLRTEKLGIRGLALYFPCDLDASFSSSLFLLLLLLCSKTVVQPECVSG